MKIEITPEEIAFRAEVREWLRCNVPATSRPFTGDGVRDFDLDWQRRQYEAGWAGIAWPEAFGGRGASLMEQLIWHEEYALAGAPRSGTCFVGLSHAGPTLIACGTQEQRQHHLPRILKGEAVWCQGFSEPNSGSDLSSLSTKAVIDGDTLIVNGSKIWTSYAQHADYQELLLRTEPGSERHRGLSWVICDMRAPGIELRPIRTMTSAEDYHFCQVFYNDVRIPLSNVVGELGEGWSTANATLGFERGTGFIADQIQNTELIEMLIDMARNRPGAGGIGSMVDDPEIAAGLSALRADAAAIRSLTYATISRAGQNNPGPEGSIVKLIYSEVAQRARKLSMDILGGDGLETSLAEGLVFYYLRSFASTIGGGTSDIQRNLIGERVLGLPRGPRL